MSKMGQYYLEQQELHGFDSDFDMACQEYQHIIWLEEVIKQGINYQMTPIEDKYYNQYMEGKLCGKQTKDVLITQDTNLKNGRLEDGPKLRKPRSKK